MFKEFEYKENILLANYSTMKTGGIAKYIVFPKNIEEIAKIFDIIKQNNLKFFIVGNGSNVLFSDDGFDGVIVKLKHFDMIEQNGESVEVGAGINLFLLNKKLQDLGLTGLEWSYGIPATLGGMVVGNAGCFGHEISELIEKVFVFDGKDFRWLYKDEIVFEYRNSNLRDLIVLSVKLHLKFEKSDEIAKTLNYYLNLKRRSQPCEYPSLGSVFKIIQSEQPVYPAKLIDNLGLKGVKIRGAEVSKKHAGFIINSGKAISKDVLELVEFLEKKLAEIGVFPKREIIVL